MRKFVKHSIVCCAILAASHVSSYGAEDQTARQPISREDAVLVTISASVEGIDYTNREVTLKGPLGNEVTFTVDQRVKRFNEIKVGDFVQADYYISIAAEVRRPTAEEEAHPIMVLDAAAKAPPGTSPAAGGLRRFKVVTTIEGLDRPTRSITVKGPRGHFFTTRVANPSWLTQVRLGEHVVVTYTEALAISLEKTEKKSAQ